MATNILPRLTEKQLTSGVFQNENQDGPVCESPRVTPLRDIESFSLLWLWPERIPLEKVTLVVGPADCGKSLLAADLAARVTRGAAWPDRPEVEQEIGAVLDVCDSPETVNAIGPRLERAGADPDLVHIFSETMTKDVLDVRPRSRGITFPDDFQQLVYAVERVENTLLVVIDSLSEFCPDATREAHTLRLLHRLAAEYSVAIVVLSRGSGRRDEQGRFQPANDRARAAARCVWTVSEDPDQPGLRQFLPARFNFGPHPGGMAFRIVDVQVTWEPARLAVRRRPSHLVEEAMLWLEDLLRGKILPSKLVQAEARECGFAPAALRSARLELGVQVGKIGFNDGSRWCWSLGMQAGGETTGQHLVRATAPHPERLPADELNARALEECVTGEMGPASLGQSAVGSEIELLDDGDCMTPGTDCQA